MATQGSNNQGSNQRGPGQANEKVEIDVGGAHVEISTGGQSAGSSGGTQSGGTRATANNGQANTSTGHKPGAVLHPETDGRLKGNEAHRPNDPDRSAQAEGGRRGGQNSHRNDGARANDDQDEGGGNGR